MYYLLSPGTTLGEKRNGCRVLFGKPEGQTQFGRPRVDVRIIFKTILIF
jgi:hypothetical protein